MYAFYSLIIFKVQMIIFSIFKFKNYTSRDIFKAVIPGYHMNKEHWNTVILNNSIAGEEIERMIDVSYGLVISNLKKSDRLALELDNKVVQKSLK